MKLLVISDLHAHNDVLDKMDSLFEQADAVLFGGDFAECFKPETGKEALEKLAGQAGVDLTKYRGGDPAVAKKKVRAKEALQLATKYYQACLTRNKAVCEYVFYQRNLNRSTVA